MPLGTAIAKTRRALTWESTSTNPLTIPLNTVSGSEVDLFTVYGLVEIDDFYGEVTVSPVGAASSVTLYLRFVPGATAGTAFALSSYSLVGTDNEFHGAGVGQIISCPMTMAGSLKKSLGGTYAGLYGITQSNSNATSYILGRGTVQLDSYATTHTAGKIRWTAIWRALRPDGLVVAAG